MEFEPVIAFPLSDPASGGAGRRSGLGPPLSLRVSYTDVDMDGRLFLICQQERGFPSRDTFGGHSTLGSFSAHLLLALPRILYKLLRIVRLLIST